MKSLVDSPDHVQVDEVRGEQSNVLEIRVANEDRGKIIGKQGRTAQAIRTILNAGARKSGTRYLLEILD